VYRDTGYYDEALEYFNQGLVVAREVRDQPGEATRLLNIGLVYHDIGQYDQALEYFNQSLVIARELGLDPLERDIIYAISQIPTVP
jgi:tetratricopeptide (TPR) repeat protein